MTSNEITMFESAVAGHKVCMVAAQKITRISEAHVGEEFHLLPGPGKQTYDMDDTLGPVPAGKTVTAIGFAIDTKSSDDAYLCYWIDVVDNRAPKTHADGQPLLWGQVVYQQLTGWDTDGADKYCLEAKNGIIGVRAFRIYG